MLRLTGLHFAYRRLSILRDVSLELRPGELVHLAGPNGAGKSTLLSITAGLLQPQRGTIAYFPGRDAAAPVDDRRWYVEYLPAEANGLMLKLDALTNLRFWCDLRGVETTRDRLVEGLSRFGLGDPLVCERFPVAKFSTGMKRRLALARVAASPAPVWLLDEPVSGLDQSALGTFRELLRGHLDRGGLAMAVSHDPSAFTGLDVRTLTLSGGVLQ